MKGNAPGDASNRFAFKVLCNTALLEDVLHGNGAGFREWIEKETGAELVLGGESDCFPGTECRVLCLFADDAEVLMAAAELIVGRLVELGDEEKLRGPPFSSNGCLGKEPGEYVFRMSLLETAVKYLIGPKGANIQALRRSTGAKLFVENSVHFSQQMTRIIGTSDAILRCLAEVLDIIRQDAGTEAYSSWVRTICSPAPAAGQGATKSAASRPGRGPAEGARPLLVPKIRAGASTPASSMPPAKAARTVATAARIGSPASGGDARAIDSIMERLSNNVARFPPGAAKLQYQVSFELPPDFVSGHASNLSEFAAFVRESTQTQVLLGVDMEPDNPDLARVVNIVGPLLNVYQAHMLLIGKVEEEEQRTVLDEEQRSQSLVEEQERSNSMKEEEEDSISKRRQLENRLREQVAAAAKQLQERRELEEFDAEIARQQQEIEAEEMQHVGGQDDLAAGEAGQEDGGAEEEGDQEGDAEEWEGPSPEEIAAQIAELQKLMSRASAKRPKAGAAATKSGTAAAGGKALAGASPAAGKRGKTGGRGPDGFI